jgi:hypothetical protein
LVVFETVESAMSQRALWELNLPKLVPLQVIQLAMALTYLVIALFAFLRAPDLVSLVICFGVGVGFNTIAKALPAVEFPLEQIWRVIGIGALVALVGLIAMAKGHQPWVCIVMSACTGNRLKAGGVGWARKG